MHGDVALPADFTHFPYANPDAPKGGALKMGVVGTFDSLNPFVLKSMRTTARGLFGDLDFGNLLYETLMQRSRDEPFTLYGLLAEKVAVDPERKWVEFTLNPKAKWSDGEPVTVDDVIFTYDILTEKGRPPYNNRMSRIEKIEKTGERSVRFVFNDKSDREFPLLIAATMPVLPKHAIDPATFGNSTLKAPVGSGPYIVSGVQPGQRIVYKLNPDYWGKDLPVRRGFDNFETLSIEYYRNETALFESFKKGLLDVFLEGNPTRWEKFYDFPAVTQGKVIKENFEKGTPANMLGFVFNTRRPVFEDRRVRQALGLLFDFEWANRNLFADQYNRLQSFWEGSELSSVGKPASARERELLQPFPDAVRKDVLDGTWHPSTTDGSGHDRGPAKAAYELLIEAGFSFEHGKAIDPSGKPLQFEIMTRSPDEEKVALAYKRNLGRLGIDAEIRSADDAQYQQRLQTFDYDMILGALTGSLSPGNEQWQRWGSASREAQGSFNYPGVADPAVDAMIEAMLAARKREDFVSAVRALDRILISGDYYIPLYYLPYQWVARWDRIGHPAKTSLYGYQLPTWWQVAQ
ncbi:MULTISPECIES: extracellular solute-binding protein [Brucella]|uniref:ABC transporter substrate-binding protein n=1 Tax=Brucella pituitosa TaxID=571256 RepID=A0A643EY63_9HYPH|nr:MULTISPECIES: extracellular solute-binding protein [Brucella]PQZ50839.1 ABC transporter substrate-binding protein [Ochrobactrum sp. MYb19]PRA55641.1 ABC transporter substrate-binding protein [Ochrobactrum sp. MYb68]PRA68882.1 ABC transporter substrate-binding protein [Ochrobactrum sp. MYb18]PRA75313.1 ABC transporter substrate-binding protein [Brucella thiophenivorans]PRA91132.1 ABC transporter substrate-binding protein [Ochrobactrum sp. MYb14]PRA97113.1 ABC transporter substrate-binding p